MKVRESGMPEEKIWNSFFDTELILSEFQIDSSLYNLVEVGSGYGTFTVPAARLLKGKLFAFDIKSKMISCLRQKVNEFGCKNIIVEQRDILTETTGLNENSVDYVMLFNILHHDSPTDFFNESYRILKPQGKIGIMHWRSDISTPRGPDLQIRPRPEQVMEVIDINKFQVIKEPFVIKPYHYGIIVSKI